jgi:DeoR/GlpR family transcriptional regulator of sugar metabolism
VLAAVRQQFIVDEVNRIGAVKVDELTRVLSVSDMTVRRDLDALARRGLLSKVYGGAVALGRSSTDEPGFERKSARAQIEKEAIATVASDLVEPGGAIALTAGTTTWTVARYLVNVPNLTIVTNSIRILQVLQEHDRTDLTVILTGGVRTPSDAFVGPVAVAAIRSLHVDLVIMGVHGLDLEAGLTTPNLLEAETNRAFVASAKRLVVVADHTKFGVVGLGQIAPLSSVDTLITDDRIDKQGRDALSQAVPGLVLAPVEGHDADEENNAERMP